MTASVNGELPDLLYRVNLFDLSLRHSQVTLKLTFML